MWQVKSDGGLDCNLSDYILPVLLYLLYLKRKFRDRVLWNYACTVSRRLTFSDFIWTHCRRVI